jgi:hypothetical protein
MKLKIISWNWKKEKLNPLISQYLGFLSQYLGLCSWSSAISIENTVIPEVKE